MAIPHHVLIAAFLTGSLSVLGAQEAETQFENAVVHERTRLELQNHNLRLMDIERVQPAVLASKLDTLTHQVQGQQSLQYGIAVAVIVNLLLSGTGALRGRKP